MALLTFSVIGATSALQQRGLHEQTCNVLHARLQRMQHERDQAQADLRELRQQLTADSADAAAVITAAPRGECVHALSEWLARAFRAPAERRDAERAARKLTLI